MQVQVVEAKKLGLTVWNVMINGTLLSSHVSQEMANTKALKFNQYLTTKAV